MSFPENSDEAKILELIYSGPGPSDILALEIIKSRGIIDKFLGAFISVIMTDTDSVFANDVLTIIDDLLNNEQRRFLKDVIKIKYSSMHSYRVSSVFDTETLADIAYTDFKRRGESVMSYLEYAPFDHPHRKEVFQYFLTKYTPRSWVDLDLSAFFVEESRQLFDKIFSAPNFKEVQSLIIDYKREYFPEEVFIDGSRKLTRLTLKNMKHFPRYIFQLTNLKSLNLGLTEGMSIPTDWSALTQLEEISFQGKGSIISNLKFVETLPNLKNLELGLNIVKRPSELLTSKRIPSRSIIRFSERGDNVEFDLMNKELGNVYIPSLPTKSLLSIAAALYKSKLENRLQEKYLKQLMAMPTINQLPTLPVYDLIVLMNVSHKGLNNAIQQRFSDISKKQKSIESLNSESLLYVTGKPKMKITEIKEKLKTLNIPFTNKYVPEVTHVLVGKKPKDFEVLIDQDFSVVFEPELYERFKTEAPGFIQSAVKEADNNVGENILHLLYSPEPSNTLVALEMLKNGGVPDELIDPVLVVYKSCPDTKARGAAKKLLDQYAPAEYAGLIADSQRFTSIEKAKAQETNKKLIKIAKSTSKELAAKLSLLFYKRYQAGLRYVLQAFKKESPERIQAFELMMEGTHLNFSKGLGFRNWKDTNPEAATFFNMSGPVPFPRDAIKYISVIESADFHNCKFKNLTEGIGKFTDLKSLDLSYNFFGSIPAAIQKLDKLEHLDLKMNSFNTFPITLKKMPNLKTLDLRYNRGKIGFHPIEITEDIRNALPNCEILV